MTYTRSFLALLIVAFTGIACSKDPEVAKREYLRSGDTYAAEGKHKEAIIEYRNAVQQDPRFGEARFKLAQSYEKVEDPTKAFGEYIRAADLLPNDVKAQTKAASMLLMARQWEDAQARADKALAVDASNVDALIAKGNALAGLQNLDAAVARIEEAIRLDPARVEAYATLGAMELARGNRDQAYGAFKKATEADPQSLPAWLALANFYWNTGQGAEVEQTLLKAISIDPKTVVAHRALAIYYVATRQVEKGEVHLKTALANSKEGRDKLALADFYLASKRRQDAVPLLQELAKGDAAHLSPANLRLASFAVVDGKRGEAHKLVDEVLQKLPKDVEALVTKSRMLIEDKRYDEGLARAQEAVQAQPKSATAQFALARAHAAKQDPNAAIAAYNAALTSNPQLNVARVELTRLYLEQNRPDDAIQTAGEALQRQPGNAEAIFLQNRAMLMKGNATAVESQVRRLATAFPKSSSAQTQLGQVAAIKGDVVGARRAFEHALKVNPNDVEALAALATLDIRAKNPAAARARLDARISPDTKDARLLLLAAQVYGAVGDATAAERTLKRVIEIDATQFDAYAMLGQFYASQRRLDEARAEFERLATMRPSTAVGAHTLIAIILQMQGKEAEAKARYEKVLAMDPRAAVAANNLAWIHAESGGNLDVALQLAQTAKSQLTNRPEINDTLGWVYYKKGLPALAIQPMKESVEQDPKNAGYHYHLGLAYLKTGDKENARKSLEQALVLDRKFDGAVEAQRILGELKG